MSVDERFERARLFYERSVFGGEAAALPAADQELDAVEADLALARGRVLHARFLERRAGGEDPRESALFERAAELYRNLGDERGEGEALFWIGVLHQVIRDDDAAAVPALERSLELATGVDDRRTMSYALRHLGIAEHRAGRLDRARERLEWSTRLRRELDFPAGVAANLVGLAYIAAGQDRRDDALALIEEASALAEAADAKGITASIEESRAALTEAIPPA
ncbi:tetratricopeptide repeat protein [Embleya sp. MST-111070]|uniref:tetratricopeptide repeat protein n=1 Tax=Embleya sp. MST-111070 TaxID=3398231 RepID=UPI003F7389BC